MAARSFVQSDTAAPSGAIAACSGATVASATAARLAVEGGGAGSTPASPNARVSRASVMFEIAPAQAGWSAGNWTIRLNVTTANAGVTWASTYVCRRTSGGSAVTSWSNSAAPVSLGTTGVKTMTVAGTAHVGSATDIAYIVLVMTTAGPTLAFGITPDQTIDSPILEAASFSGSPSIPGVTAAGAGSPVAAGAAVVAIPGVTAAGAGSPIATMAGATSIPGVTADGDGTPIAAGAGAAAIPGITASGAGGSIAPAILSGAVSIAGVTAAGAGTPIASISGGPSIPGVTAAGAGTPVCVAAGAVSLPGVVGIGRGAGSYLAIGAPAWLDGFEINGSAAAAADIYETADVSDATYEDGYLGGTALASRTADVRIVTPEIIPSGTWAIGMRIKASSPVERRLIGIWNGDPDSAGTLEAELVLIPVLESADRWRMEFRSGTGVKISSSRSIGSESWTLLEVLVTLGDSRFGELEIRMNGISLFTAQDVEIRSGPSGGIADRVELGAESNGTAGSWIMVDDFSVRADLVGNKIARGMLPTGAGDSTEWTPTGAATNHEAVDESPGTDGDTSYVELSGAGDDLYVMSPPSARLGDSVVATVDDAAVRVTAGSEIFSVRRRDGSTTVDVVSVVLSSTAYVRIRGAAIVSPFDGGRIDRSDLDAQQVGVGVQL